MTNPAPPSAADERPWLKLAIFAGVVLLMFALAVKLGSDVGPLNPHSRESAPEGKKKRGNPEKLRAAGAAWRERWAAMTTEERKAYKAAKKAKGGKK